MMKPMQGTQRLLDKLRSHPQGVGWQDLVGDPHIPHGPRERERLLQTGTAGHQAHGGNLWDGWQKPWLFWDVLKLGMVLIAACFASVYGCQLLLNTTTVVAVQMLYLVPPMVVPVVLMIFFWELNVPRNLSIWELLAFFMAGTLLSLAVNALMFALVGGAGGSVAALREEPAKLLAGVALICYCGKSKGKRVYGLTGLVIGAAVGSGFSAFETISYGLQYDLETVMVRVFFAVVGHTLYSCSYLAALALHAPGGHITAASFFNSDFLLTFGCSVFCHGLWNTSQIPLGLRFPVTLVLLWYSALWITRKALRQILPGTPQPTVSRGGEGFSHIELRCLRGDAVGMKWSYPISQQIAVGRSSANQVSLPKESGGISRNHCFLEAGSLGWTVTDTNSTYGTYLQLPGESIHKLVPGKRYPITSGALLYLGSQKFCLGISIF